MKYVLLFCLSIGSAFGGTFSRTKAFLANTAFPAMEKKQEAKLRLDTLSTDLTDLKTAEQWQDILDELNAASMPPKRSCNLKKSNLPMSFSD